jgi:hypothetical protein
LCYVERMARAYFVRRRGSGVLVGPVSSAQLKSMASSGELSPDDEIGISPDGPWRSARRVGNLAFPTTGAPSSEGADIPELSDEDLRDPGMSGLVPSSASPPPIDVTARPVAEYRLTEPTIAPPGSSPGVVVVRREAISPSEAVQFALDRFRANPIFYVLASMVVALVVHIPGAGFWFIAAPVLIGFYQCVRDEIATGKPASLLQIFRGFGQFVPALVIGLWGSLLVVLGLLFCCIPGLILLPVPFLAFIVAGRERAGGLKALTRALRVVEKDPWGLLASSVLLYLIGLSGILLCYVGVLITLPIMLIGLYRVADQMLSTEDA